MKRVWRLIRYMRPYTLQWVLSVLLMAVFAAMAAFRIMLITPIIDHVLSAAASPDQVLVFAIPHTNRHINLQFLIPHHFHNAWTVVAVALVGSAIVKSICDYLGTLLANKAGFGMITDLRNDLYDSVLRRSSAFFQKHTTGTLLSTLISDVERVQTALSTVMSDFLQQLFTMIFLIGAVVLLG
jgi:subfamily B ATP-binding cassette protein MsbA